MRDIPGYEGLYAATEDGRIWSYPKPPRNPYGMWMKQRLVVDTERRQKPRRTYQVKLRKNEHYRSFMVHQLVALAYLPNPDRKPDINHIDGDTLHNDVTNIEWATKLENMEHAKQTGLLDPHSGRQDDVRSANGRKTIAVNGLKRKFLQLADYRQGV